MRAMIVTFDFSEAAESGADWRRQAVEESIPRFEALAGLRNKVFLWREEPPAAVTVYLFADDEAFRAYSEPVLEDSGRFTTVRRYGVPATIEVLDVVGIADGPEAPGVPKAAPGY